MHKVDKVVLENFKGQSGSFDLDQLTAISGGNESGKTTITDAVQFALLGYIPGDFVNRSNPDEFEAYCSHDKGTMSIEIHSEGKIFRVEYSKPKNVVTRKCTCNGVDIEARAKGKDYLDIKLVDIKKYWDSTPAIQVATLFHFVDADPAKLEDLNEKIGRANEAKKQAQKRKNEEEQALEDHQRELQGINDLAENFNPQTAEDELKELNAKLDRLNSQINNSIQGATKRESLEESLLALKRLNIERGEELSGINIPDPEETPESLDKDLESCQFAKDTQDRIEKAEERIKELRAKEQPISCPFTRSDIEDCREKLIEAKNAGGGPTERDRVGYEIGKSIFELMRDKEVIHEEERRQCLNLVREACKDFKAAMEGPMIDDQKVRDLSTDVDNMELSMQSYEIRIKEWRFSQEEARDLEVELKNLNAPAYDEKRHSDLLQKKAMLGAKNAEVERLTSRKAQIESDMAEAFELIETKEKALSLLPDIGDVESLTQERDNISGLIPALRDGIQAQVKYDTIKALADKKEITVDEWAAKVSVATSEEKKYLKEKSDLLEEVQNALADRADKILAPARMTFTLPQTTKSTDRIRFLYHQTNGKVVDRATVSGAQAAEFDLALSHALVGENGLVVADEVNRLDPERLDRFFKQVVNAKNRGAAPQTVMVGHSLTKYESDDVKLIDMGKGWNT